MGKGRGAERRRKAVVRALMRVKVEDAQASLAEVKGRSKVKEAYLTRRWGHNVGALSAFKVICQEQVEEAWKRKGEKCTSKLQHLELRWMRDERLGEQKLLNY